MNENWVISKKLITFLQEIWRNAGPAAEPGTLYYPVIMWTDGGWAEKPGHAKTALPPRYVIGWERADNPHPLVSIPNDTFGFILFGPKRDDEISTRRYVDFNGTHIVVR